MSDTVASGPLQAVLLNTAGGLAGDDNILWAGSAEDQAHLSISTAACEKIYRSHGTDANQTTRLNVGVQRCLPEAHHGCATSAVRCKRLAVETGGQGTCRRQLPVEKIPNTLSGIT